MAYLEYIDYTPSRSAISQIGEVSWTPEPTQRRVKSLPMIFWSDGTPWNEVNHWAHERITSGAVKLKTVQGQMSHLHKYAAWLELQDSPNWKHFPMNRAARVIQRWRKYLIDCRDSAASLAPSTTTSRMNACIAFYRHCADNGFIDREATMWKDVAVVIKYHDTTGFRRAVERLTTDVSIKCRTIKRTAVEEGLLPLSSTHMTKLLEFTERSSTTELHLMMKIGFFTGARLQTICGLNVQNLERAVQDNEIPGLWRIAVGPGSRPLVDTKFDVSGDLLVPGDLLTELRAYAFGVRRIKRVIKALPNNKSLLFITSHGNSYCRNNDAKRSSAVNSEMVKLRRNARSSGLSFLAHVHFHQTRATYGTELMKILLPFGNIAAALEFTRAAMFHKDVSTTMMYVKFIEHSKSKMQVADAYSRIFMGLRKDRQD